MSAKLRVNELGLDPLAFFNLDFSEQPRKPPNVYSDVDMSVNEYGLDPLAFIGSWISNEKPIVSSPSVSEFKRTRKVTYQKEANILIQTRLLFSQTQHHLLSCQPRARGGAIKTNQI
jgi:hypothetical protein